MVEFLSPTVYNKYNVVRKGIDKLCIKKLIYKTEVI